MAEKKEKMMRVLHEVTHGEHMLRLMSGWTEVAYIVFGISGLQANIEFPSDWHEYRRGWIRIGIGFCRFAVSFPWKWTVPDDYQCSGPTYGFQFFADMLWISYGKSHGRRDDPRITFKMPWGWRHREHKILTEPETHPFKYTLRNGTVQERTATIQIETRLWTRPWLPRKLFKKTIDVKFSDEVGERSGSWKGGVMGCGYDMKPGETAIDTLRRMERERTFT